jgi:hypothetical protein
LKSSWSKGAWKIGSSFLQYGSAVTEVEVGCFRGLIGWVLSTDMRWEMVEFLQEVMIAEMNLKAQVKNVGKILQQKGTSVTTESPASVTDLTSYVHMHPYTQNTHITTHAHIHTCIHTHTHTPIYTKYTHNYTHTHTHMLIYTKYTHVYTHTHMYTHTHTHTHAHIHKIHTYIHRHIHAHICVICVYVYIDTCVYIYM